MPATRIAPWLRVAGTMFGIGWGANQFVSMLIAYREYAGLSVPTANALFGVYALGLIPALLVGGPVSDRRGRAALLKPSAAVSVLATTSLMLGAHTVGLLYLGRFLAGLASGAVFAAGTAWVKELSSPPFAVGAGEQAGARRAAVALSLGFCLGPVTAGFIAQWAPAPLVLPYVAHLVVMVLVVPPLLRAPETVPSTARDRPRRGIWPRAAAAPRFRGVVVPLGPWTFLAPSTAFAVLPGLVAAHTHGLGIAFAALAGGLSLGTGVLVQPLARRLDGPNDPRGTSAGLACAVVGFALAAATGVTASPLVAVAAAIPLGAAYGFCLVSGLLETQRLADPQELAGLTAVFYALTYVGFAGPYVYAEASTLLSYQTLFVITAVLGGASLTTTVVQGRRHRVGVRPAGAGA